jgi:hypothetical protein
LCSRTRAHEVSLLSEVNLLDVGKKMLDIIELYEFPVG